MMTQKWDERYQEVGFAYGAGPNLFFERWLKTAIPGQILMPADGEGRNGVYAAEQGWQVTSCDLSEAGRTKALQLAKDRNVSLNYMVGDLQNLSFEKNSFDAIGLIYAHFPASIKSAMHKKLDQTLKPGGLIIFEAFSKTHLELRMKNPKVGGPKDLESLFSKEEVASDFANYKPLYFHEELVLLSEGKYHNGQGSVIRFVGIKQ